MRSFFPSGIVFYLLRRTLVALPVLLLIALVSFVMIRASPGGPFVTIGQRAASAEMIAALEKYYGLDRPLLLNLPGDPEWQFLHYVDEEHSERVEVLALRPDTQAALDVLTSEPTNQSLDTSLLQHLIFYRDQGVQRGELTDLLNNLAAARPAVDSETAAQIDLAIEEYESIDVAQERVSPRMRTTIHSVLYSDLFQSQFGNYVFNMLRFNFGPSLGTTSRGRMVHDMISEKLPVSIALGIMAVATALFTGIPLGVIAAVNHNKAADHGAMFFAIIGRAVPNIVLGPVLIIIFAVQLKLVPVVNPYVWLQGPQPDVRLYLSTALLPVITLAMGMSATIARLTRATLLDVLNQDYIRTARSKGLQERNVIYRHALRNSLLPVVTILGPLLAAVLTGTFVVELVFAIPGLGDTFVNSVTTRDYNLLVGVTILYSVFLVAANILVDVAYMWLDPRVYF